MPAPPNPDTWGEESVWARRAATWGIGLTDIFSEVGEDVRNARLKALWDRYGVLLIGAAVALVVGVAISVYWQGAGRAEREAAAARLFEGETLLLAGKTTEAAEFFARFSQQADSDGYRLLARMKQAAALVESGDSNGAAAIYDALAADGRFDSLLRDLAALKAAMLLADSISPDELKLRLAPLTEADNPWRHSARELLAFMALRQGEGDQALAGFQSLTDDLAAPPGIRARAAEMLLTLPAPAPSSAIK